MKSEAYEIDFGLHPVYWEKQAHHSKTMEVDFLLALARNCDEVRHFRCIFYILAKNFPFLLLYLLLFLFFSLERIGS